MNTLELIQIAYADADAWESCGSTDFAKEHGLTLGYHTDAEEVRHIIEKFEAHGDLEVLEDSLYNLDTIVREAMFNTFEAIDELKEEEGYWDDEGQPSWEQEWADFGEEY